MPSFIQNIKKYYSDKRMLLRYLFLLFILFIIVLQFIKPKTQSVQNYTSQSSDISSLNFAGEIVPMDGIYSSNQERFDREMLSMITNDSQFILTYKRQGLYLPYIHKQLKKYDIPLDFQYLPMIESYLKNSAVSSAGAAGMRQFMPGTAKKYGLIVDDFVDQRFDYQKATDSAVQYLQDLYSIFGNRTLVAAAYNRGEYGLLADMQSQSQSGYYDLYLNNETYRFVFRLLAMKYLMENAGQYFDTTLLGSQYISPETKTISVDQIQDLKLRSLEKNHSYLQIKQLNPWIRKNSLYTGNREIQIFK
ncbi:lytic transglycosylase domain-containing protein [Candidatus Gracilibacteria bacterium]|nr:lytic transglycosylase domain-containing protein [Candidatus Gracilibacteria bacterium]